MRSPGESGDELACRDGVPSGSVIAHRGGSPEELDSATLDHGPDIDAVGNTFGETEVDPTAEIGEGRDIVVATGTSDDGSDDVEVGDGSGMIGGDLGGDLGEIAAVGEGEMGSDEGSMDDGDKGDAGLDVGKNDFVIRDDAVEAAGQFEGEGHGGVGMGWSAHGSGHGDGGDLGVGGGDMTAGDAVLDDDHGCGFEKPESGRRVNGIPGVNGWRRGLQG